MLSANNNNNHDRGYGSGGSSGSGGNLSTGKEHERLPERQLTVSVELARGANVAFSVKRPALLFESAKAAAAVAATVAASCWRGRLRPGSVSLWLWPGAASRAVRRVCLCVAR